MKNLLMGTSPNSRSTDLGLVILRVVAGLAMALGHGLGKLPPSEKFIEGVGGMGFPFPPLFAWSAGLSEFVGGILLTLGFLTRPASLFVAMTMATALFIRHATDPFQVKEKALIYLCVALLFLIAGAGRYSVDRLLDRDRRS